MTRQELIDKIAEAGWEMVQTKQVESKDVSITHYAVAAVKESADGVLDRKWFNFYQKSDGSVYWQGKDPLAEPASVPIFVEEVQQYIKAKVEDGTLIAAKGESIDPAMEIAIIVGYYTDAGGVKEKRYLVNRNSEGGLQHRPIS